MPAREDVASVQRANGAWLIAWMGTLTDDLTPDQMYDAASNLTVAKRVAVEGARQIGHTGAVRWRREYDGKLWWLEMTTEEDD